MPVQLFAAVPDQRRMLLRVQRLVGMSYAVDALVLGLFSIAGAAPAWLPLADAGAGLMHCALFYTLIRSDWSARFADRNLTVAQMAVATSFQLILMALAPTVGLYFVSVLFVIFGFGSLRLRVRQAATAFAFVAVALTVEVIAVPGLFVLPHDSALQRGLVGLSVLLTLARCALLGLMGRQMRAQLRQRQAVTRASLQASEADRLRTATLLQDDLGQELAGVALLLSAAGARVRPQSEPCAADIARAAEHLRRAIEKTRVLAATTYPDKREHARSAG